MPNPPMLPQKPDATQSAIASLAQETDLPVEAVKVLYCEVQARMEQTARIKTYLPVLTRRRVKELLQFQRLVS
jgi:hypothetical protein